MRIVIVGPGIMPIPPTGWGAVEILIWDYYQELIKLGHEVLIVNTPNRKEIINQTLAFNPDFIHIQYDEFIDIVPAFDGIKVAITSHYGYLDQVIQRQDGYFHSIFKDFKNYACNIFCLSESIKNVYKQIGIPENKLFVTPNGVRCDLFKFKENAIYPDRSIYLAKIDYRKRQHLFQKYNANIWFAGNVADGNFNTSHNYLGEWSKEYLYNNLTDYANLILLSDGEAHPLVCVEAMSAGLGLVISEFATANLDLTKPFITVIPESKIHDVEFVRTAIEENRKVSITMRNDILKYVSDNFNYPVVVNNYLNAINQITND